MARSVIAMLFVYSAAAFSPSILSSRRVYSCASLHANKKDDNVNKFTSSLVVAATIFATVISNVEPASAQADSFYLDFSGSTEVLAARSGGRTGGRSSRAYRPSPSRSAGTRTRIYNSNTRIIQPSYSPPIIVTPGFGFGYNPFGGFGLGLGYGAVGSVGNVMQDIRQDNELDRVQAELQAEKIKEADMEARLRALENATKQQLTPQLLQAQPQAADVSQ